MTDSSTDQADAPSVLVVGGGVAGLCAALYTARAGLDTLVVDGGDSILRRNAHLENVPGFPVGVNSNTYLDLLTEQAERNGVRRREGRVVDVHGKKGDFRAVLDDGDSLAASRVVAASWSDADYLDTLDVSTRTAGSKRFVETDECGRTDVDGVYAAGRLAETEHQTVVVAGHGAEVGIALARDAEVPFYHDWVAPEGYFTGRGREVPPGCEEISETERAEREAESLQLMREAFADPHPDPQRTHPSLTDE